MKNIFYFGNFDYIKGFAASNRAIGNAVCLNKLGFNTTIYGGNFTEFANNKFAKSNNIRCVETNKKKIISNYLGYKSYINILKNNKVDIVILYNMPSLPFFKILSFCKKNGIKVFSDVTEWYSTKGVNFFLKIFKWADTFIRMRILNKKCDGIIVISSFLRKYYKNVNNIIQVYPIMDYVKWQAESYFYNRDKTTEGVFTLVGREILHKDNFKLLEKIVNSNQCNIFNVIGMEKELFRKKTKIYDDKVHCYSCLTREEIINIYSSTTFNYIVRNGTRSNNAGFPSKFAESIILDIPVFYNHFSDLPILEKKYSFGIKSEKIDDIQKLDIKIDDDFKKLFQSDYYLSDFLKFLGSVK